MSRNIKTDYFEWLYDLVCHDRYDGDISYRDLLLTLHDIEFIFVILKDENRAEDGKDLRYRFCMSHDMEDDYLNYADGCYIPPREYDRGFADFVNEPCSVLEMIIALAIRCEESIMDDPIKGDRTGQWFWNMINNLGLGGMYNERFDPDYVEEQIDIFMNREYSPDGEGGLFTIKDINRDLRDVEIWYQLCWYLDSFIGY